MLKLMPILGIKSKARFSQIIADLENWGFLQSIKQKGGKTHNMKFIAIGPSTDQLTWSEVLNTFNTPVKSIKHPLLNTFNTYIDNNKNNKTIKIDDAEQGSTTTSENESDMESGGTSPQPAMKPKFCMNPNEDNDSERKKPEPRKITDPKFLEVLDLFKKRIFKNCTARTKSIYEGIPRAEKIFEGYFGKDGHTLLLSAIDQLPSYDKFQWMLTKSPTANAPKTIFSETFIENHLIAIVTKTNIEQYENTDPNLVKRATTEEERGKIQDANKERVRKFMEQFKSGDTE